MLLTTHIWRNISRNSLSFWFAFWQKRSPTSGPPWSYGFFGQPRHATKWMPLIPPREVEMVTLNESMLDKSNIPHLHMPSASLTNLVTVKFGGASHLFVPCRELGNPIHLKMLHWTHAILPSGAFLLGKFFYRYYSRGLTRKTNMHICTWWVLRCLTTAY